MNHFKLTRSCITSLSGCPKISLYGIGFRFGLMSSYKLRIGYI